MAKKFRITPSMIDAGARIIVRHETAGLCELGSVCGLCDCFAYEDGGESRDLFAKKMSEEVLWAAFGKWIMEA